MISVSTLLHLSKNERFRIVVECKYNLRLTSIYTTLHNFNAVSDAMSVALRFSNLALNSKHLGDVEIILAKSRILRTPPRDINRSCNYCSAKNSRNENYTSCFTTSCQTSSHNHKCNICFSFSYL